MWLLNQSLNYTLFSNNDLHRGLNVQEKVNKFIEWLFKKSILNILKNKTHGLQLRTVSESKINPLINPVNTNGRCWDKNYYYNIWNSVQRDYISNFLFIAKILTKLLAEMVKLTHLLALLTPGWHTRSIHTHRHRHRKYPNWIIGLICPN